MKRLLGIKKEMSQYFYEDGKVVPITIVDISENYILERKTLQEDGYDSVVIGQGKKKNPSKSELGIFKQLGFVPMYVKESRDESVEGDLPKQNDTGELTNKSVSVTGVTKGKGFQGVVKRWGFKGGKETHGQSDRVRAAGAIGTGTTPGRVVKGKKMAGRMGGETQTIKNLVIVKHLVEEKLILIKGGLPGARGSKLIITIID